MSDQIQNPAADAATSPLADFSAGQWWINELDALASHPVGQQIRVTADAKRAVSVVHHLLRAAAAAPFQPRVQPWMMECFGPVISADKQERNHRFLEEAIELVQAGGCTRSESHQLVDYVFGRPVGELGQEVGGTMVTLAALCLAHGVDMHAEAERELARINVPETVAKIRAKQAAKPKHSPLPQDVCGQVATMYAAQQEAVVHASVAVPALDVRAIAAAVCQRVAELPDRDSPEDWPEAMLVTGQELIDAVADEIEQALSQPAAAARPAPATFMTEDRALEWAWDKLREDLGTKGWTAGDFSNFYGFFLHGWDYRGQYELQRSSARAALTQELMTAATALEAPAAESKCAQCKKAYKPGSASVGCPKCAPGVQISEVEFQKPPAAAPQAPAAPAFGLTGAQAVQALQEMWDDLEKSGSPRVNARAMRYYSDALSTVERALAGPAEPVEPAEPVTPPVIDAKAMKEAFDCATAEGKSFNDALRAAACATIWRRAKRPDGAPDAVGAALVSIAVDCALHAEERHSYLPNTPAQAATWRPHEWVLKAMSRAISFDHMMNQVAPAAPVVQLHPARAGRIYVAGPMTGLPDHNFPAFNAAAKNLRANGWHVENPAEHGVVAGAEWADYLHYDIGRLSTCSAVHLLPGWSKSRGAALEVHVATTLGMAVFYADGAEHVANVVAPAAPAAATTLLDVCTDPHNCARCKAHPNHRGGLEHAGISRFERKKADDTKGGAE